MIKVGIAAFSSPIQYDSTEQKEAYVKQSYQALCRRIAEEADFVVCAPLERSAAASSRAGICCDGDVDACADRMRAEKSDCLLLQVSQWTDPALAVALVKQLGIPAAIYVSDCPDWPGETIAAAIVASLREMPGEMRECIHVQRFHETTVPQLLRWVRGAGAVTKMRRGRLFLWGGSYGANIPYSREDAGLVERLFVREMKTEEELTLYGRAQKLLADEPLRVKRFQEWLLDSGCKLSMDGQMFHQGAFDLQSAQYLAARDRLEGESDILAAAVKCHYGVSSVFPGCTECFLPAFLPLSEDSEGRRTPIPVACEGDVKGTLTMAILFAIAPKAPPLFGDVIFSGDGGILVKNCGAHGVYWAARSWSGAECLSKVELLPQSHGKSGASVKFMAAPGPVTVARLFRVTDRFYMYLGKGEILPQNGYMPGAHGASWPQALVRLPASAELIFQTLPCNHLCLTDGDRTEEVTAYCRAMGISVLRCDSDSALTEFCRAY